MRMRRLWLLGWILCGAIACLGAEPDWVAHMKEVHGKPGGKKGVIVKYGDSITYTRAFFCPLQWGPKNVPAELKDTAKWIKGYIQKECWKWEGGANGCYSGTTADWGLKGMDKWLKKHNPEVALIMWGTNDTKKKISKEKYKATMSGIVDKVLANGTIPVLYTIPPRASQGSKADVKKVVESYVEAVREIAAEKKIPLIDFYQEILTRQPTDFGKTLMGDELHPSYPKGHQNDFKEESLKLSGYTLRNYLTLKMLHEIRMNVLEAK
jgi:hypothetical protein